MTLLPPLLSRLVKQDSRYRIVVGAIISAVTVLLLYLPVWSFEFLNFDDPEYVTSNSWIAAGLTTEGITAAFKGVRGAHWHPLTWLSHMLDIELFGLDAGMHHGVNVLFHAGAVAFFFCVVLSLTNSFSLSLWAALLWGVHPLRMESVAWVSERKDVLCTFLSLLSLLCYCTFKRTGSLVWHLSSFCAFLLALLAKPTAITLPLLFLLLDYWPYARLQPFTFKHGIKLIGEKIHYFLASIALVIAAMLAQHEGGGLKTLSEYGLADRAASVLVGYLTYAGKFFIPTGLGIFYPFEQYQPGVAAGAFLGLVMITVWIVSKSRATPALLFGWLWFIVTLLPMVGIVQIGGQAFADRWTYLAHGGLIIGLGVWWQGSMLRTRMKRWSIVVPLVTVISALSITATYLPHWRSTESIFRHTIEVTPDNFMAQMNLAVELERQGRLDEAYGGYERAVLSRPYYPLAVINFGRVLLQKGEVDKAEYLFERLALYPSYDLSSRIMRAQLSAQRGYLFVPLQHWLFLARAYPQDVQIRRNLESTVGQLWDPDCQKIALRTRDPLELRSALAMKKMREQMTLPSTLDSALQRVLSCLVAR
jgi:hypothetical protein